jgi:hypothetical protein
MKKLLIPLLILPAVAPLFALTAVPSRTESFYPAWTRTHDSTLKASQFARAIAMDSNGNVFVTGHVDVNASKQLYVAKYDALDGRRLWQRTIPASGTNQVLANAIAVDKFGDCIVAGSLNIAGTIDFYTHKFSGDTGADGWMNGPRTYDGTAGGQDIALKVVTDGFGNVIVTGRSAGSGSGDDIVTLKYARLNGDSIGVTDRYSAAGGTLHDFPGALAVDGSGSVYVGGVAAVSAGTQHFVVRKLGADLTAKWTITPINTGGEGGVTGLAVDSEGNVVATGLARNASNQFGYFTTKRSGATGNEIWKTSTPSPISESTFGTPRPGPVGVAIGPDDQPIVSGTLLDASGQDYIATVKYTKSGTFGNASLAWPGVTTDSGPANGDTVASAVATDADSNAIVVGASVNEDGNRDMYIAKYDAITGRLTYSERFAGAAGVDDSAVGAVVDRLGNIAVLGNVGDSKGGSPGVSYRMFATIKLNRFIALTGDVMPHDPGVPNGAIFSAGNAPAVADDGSIVAKVTLSAGKKKLNAIFAQGGGGLSNIPAVQGEPAPGTTGAATVGNWVSFSDPVIAPKGNYAFAAKISGPTANANGLWTNASGQLRLALQQGKPVPGLNPAGNLSSILSYSMNDGNLFALIKVAGPAASSTVLLRLSNNGSGAVLLRAGAEGLMIDGTAHTVKSFTALSPAPASPGDGRWNGTNAILARVVATETNNPKVTRQALLRISSDTGAIQVLSHGGHAAPEVASGRSYQSFGLPATATNGFNFAFSGKLDGFGDGVSATNDTALIFTGTGSIFNAFAREGGDVPGIATGAKYSAFSDPIVSVDNVGVDALFLATLKSGAGVTAANNGALIFGPPVKPANLSLLVRTGADAAQPLADNLEPTEPITRYGAFTAFALTRKARNTPVFVANLKGAPKSSNVALFARGSDGSVRRLLRTGDELDGRKVKTFTLLKPVPKAFAAARSFNGTGSVVVQLRFTDGKTALTHIAIP